MPSVRVYELAKRHELASYALIELLNEIEISVDHHMCGLDEEQVRRAEKLLARIERGKEPLVFLCYSTKDKKFMERLRRDLTAAGCTVWTAERIPPGSDSWARDVESAIKRSRCMVVVLSENANKSRWVIREISYAEQNDKPIIGVLARGDPKRVIPLELAAAQWVDARRSKYGAALKKLKRALPC